MKRLMDAIEQGERLISEFEYNPEGGQGTNASRADKSNA
jgi:hypothetical protein